MTDRDEFAKAAINEQKDKMTIDKKAYEGDVVSRLRNWRGLHLAHGGELFEEAADEIELLRGYRDEAEADAAIAHLLVDKLRLTDAERALLEMLADHPVTHEIMPNEVATLRGLLERLGGQT